MSGSWINGCVLAVSVSRAAQSFSTLHNMPRMLSTELVTAYEM